MTNFTLTRAPYKVIINYQGTPLIVVSRQYWRDVKKYRLAYLMFKHQLRIKINERKQTEHCSGTVLLK